MDPVTIPLESLVFSRTLRSPADRAKLYRAAHNGEFVAISRGVYVRTELWSAATREERHRAAIRAVNAVRHGLVFGSISAAVLWGQPLLHNAPLMPVAIRPTSAGGRSDANVTVRETCIPFETELIENLRVTPLARSVVDAARSLSFTAAVAMLDHAISPIVESEIWPQSARVSIDEVLAELDRGTHVGRGRARAAAAFADGASGSAGESFSRVVMSDYGFPRPRLQHPFYDAQGLIGVVDFWWPELGIIGEFDGQGKYLRDEFTRGRSQAEVIADEKRRENRLRALGYIVVRWEWADLIHPERLREKLIAVGLRLH